MTNTLSSFGYGGYKVPLRREHKPEPGEKWCHRLVSYPAGKIKTFTYIGSVAIRTEGEDDQTYWIMRNDAGEYSLLINTYGDWERVSKAPKPLPTVEML